MHPDQIENTPVMTSALEWFALKVRTKAEDSVCTVLRGKGYETFLPTFVSVRKYSDRLKKISAPLFPGYVFCKMDRNRRLPVLLTAGVEYAVGFGGRLEAIPAAEINAIEAVASSGLQLQPWPFLNAGDRVRIANGSMTGVEGILIRTHGVDRLVLSIEMLQRSISVEIERTWVRPISEGSIIRPIDNLLT